MTIKFYLDQPNSKVETAIYLFLRFGKTTLKFNTREKINPKYWNPDNTVNHFRKFTGSPEMNNALTELRSNVNKTYYSKSEWTIEDLKKAVLDHINKNLPKDSQQTFKDALAEFISSRKNSNALAKNTIKKYNTLSSHLEDYSSFTKVSLRFEAVNKKFFDDFSSYLRNQKKHTTNTVNKYLKTFKTFIHWSVESGYTRSEMVNTKYKISDDATEIIYLTYDELMRLFHLDVPHGSALANVRDVFCFGCFTGQRFSDIAALKHEDIQHDKWVLHQIKVKDTVKNEIPLSDKALEILARYKDAPRPLPVVSNQKTNVHIKTLGKKANIEDVVKVVRYRGNEPVIAREPKYSFLGTHTARRTFITLSLEMKMRPETVMAISGHSDYKTMKRYIAVTEKMKAKELDMVWNQPDDKAGKLKLA